MERQQQQQQHQRLPVSTAPYIHVAGSAECCSQTGIAINTARYSYILKMLDGMLDLCRL